MNKLFKSTGNSFKGMPLYSWSARWIERLSCLDVELSNLETSIMNIDPAEPYGLTYTILNDVNLSANLLSAVEEMAGLLVKLNPSDGIVMFERLVFDQFSSKSLHNLFTLLSQSLVKKEGSALSFHSPIKSESVDKGFPIHADLFKAKALLNVISRTDEFDGGDMLLISSQALSEAMDLTSTMPKDVKEYVKEVLKTRIANDSFDSIYNLMHGDYAWVPELEKAIEVTQFQIPAEYGAGYFVVDGQWLHGRTKIEGPVSETRLQRLVFDTEYTASLPSLTPSKSLNTDWLYKPANRKSQYKAEKGLQVKSKSIPNQKAIQKSAQFV